MSIVLNPSIRKSIITLTDAQIRFLPTVPIDLVAAPGASKMIVPWSYWLVMTMIASYTNINGTTPFFVMQYSAGGNEGSGYIGNDNTIPAVTTFTDFFAFGTGLKRYRLPSSYYDDRGAAGGWGLIGDFTGLASTNKILQATINNQGTGNLTGGDVGNSLKIVTYYSIEDTA